MGAKRSECGCRVTDLLLGRTRQSQTFLRHQYCLLYLARPGRLIPIHECRSLPRSSSLEYTLASLKIPVQFASPNAQYPAVPMRVTIPRLLESEIAFIWAGKSSMDAVPSVSIQAADAGFAIDTTPEAPAGQWRCSPPSHVDEYFFVATFEIQGQIGLLRLGPILCNWLGSKPCLS